MQISLRVRLDTDADAIVVELEPGAPVKSLPLKIEGSEKVIEVGLDAHGYITSVTLPHLQQLIDVIAGTDKKKPKPPPAKND